MAKTKGNKSIPATYKASTKTLEINISKSEVVPGYLYYLCKYIESIHNIVIKRVYFAKDVEMINITTKLRGIKDWSEL